MLDRLRVLFFILAAIVLLLVIGLELGSSLLPAQFNATLMGDQTRDALKGSDLSDSDKNDLTNQMVQSAQSSPKPPGMAIPDMALMDGVLFYAVLLMGLALLFPERFLGRIQGLATLIVSIIVIVVAVILAFKAFAELMIMVSLFLAAPFGTIAYLAVWGFFQRGAAATILSISLLLKLIFTVLLVLAHQRFLQNKGLVGLIITSVACCFLIGFLHAFVPGILVSITDAIAAIVVLILIIIWAVFMLIGAVISVIKAIL